MVKDGSGWGAVAGVSAAYLAQTGFTGAPANLLEGDAWLDLGQRWLILEQYVNPEPVCRWAQPAVHAAQNLQQTNAFEADQSISRIALGDAVKRDSNKTLKYLVEGGFTYPQADWARNAIDSHIYGYVLQELNFPVQVDEYQATAAQYLPMIEREKYPYSYEATAAVANGHYDGINSFNFGLDLIIDGLKRWVAD